MNTETSSQRDDLAEETSSARSSWDDDYPTGMLASPTRTRLWYPARRPKQHREPRSLSRC